MSSDNVDKLVTVRRIADREELIGALRLIHDRYVRKDYMSPHRSGIRIGVHYALATTRTFVALLDGEVIATVSLFHGSRLNLPSDAGFADMLDVLRTGGRAIAEVGMFADRRHAVERSLPILLKLMKCVYRSAVQTGIDDLIVTVHPHHEAFYQRMFGFEILAPPRPYQPVNGAAVALLKINIKDIDPANLRSDQLRELFFSQPEPTDSPAHAYLMRREDLRDFFVIWSDVFVGLTPRQTEVIEEHYPGINIAEMLKSSPSRPRLEVRPL